MRIFECDNCHSLFIVNESDERIRDGNYGAPVRVDCPMCMADMFLLPEKKQEENEE